MCYTILQKGGDNIAEQQKPKRKTHTSSEVKQRYNKKTYKTYGVNFRIIEDAEAIKAVEGEKEKGFSTSEAFKRLILKK